MMQLEDCKPFFRGLLRNRAEEQSLHTPVDPETPVSFTSYNFMGLNPSSTQLMPSVSTSGLSTTGTSHPNNLSAPTLAHVSGGATNHSQHLPIDFVAIPYSMSNHRQQHHHQSQ